MKNYNPEKLELVKKYVESKSDDVYYEIFENRYDIIMFVDWREYDEDIINYCEAILETENLSVETIDTENKQGFETIIHYQDKATKVPYQGEGADRDTTIITLNEVLEPNYEIRLCKVSIGNDTLEFLPLPTEIWNQLESEFPENIDVLFQKIDKSTILF